MSAKVGDLVGEVYFNPDDLSKHSIHLGFISKVCITPINELYQIDWDDDYKDEMLWELSDIAFFKECLRRYQEDPVSCIIWMLNEKEVR